MNIRRPPTPKPLRSTPSALARKGMASGQMSADEQGRFGIRATQALVNRLRSNLSAVEASGFHGILTGAVCVHAPKDIDALALFEPDPAARPEIDGPTREALGFAVEAIADTLENDAFTPALPPDDTDLDERVAALSEWCNGFLFGIASRKGLHLGQASADAKELISDLTEIARAGLDAEGTSSEESEMALTEIAEHLKVAAQTLFFEWHGLRKGPRQMPPPPPTRH